MHFIRYGLTGGSGYVSFAMFLHSIRMQKKQISIWKKIPICCRIYRYMLKARQYSKDRAEGKNKKKIYIRCIQKQMLLAIHNDKRKQTFCTHLRTYRRIHRWLEALWMEGKKQTNKNRHRFAKEWLKEEKQKLSMWKWKRGKAKKNGKQTADFDTKWLETSIVSKTTLAIKVISNQDRFPNVHHVFYVACHPQSESANYIKHGLISPWPVI